MLSKPFPNCVFVFISNVTLYFSLGKCSVNAFCWGRARAQEWSKCHVYRKSKVKSLLFPRRVDRIPCLTTINAHSLELGGQLTCLRNLHVVINRSISGHIHVTYSLIMCIINLHVVAIHKHDSLSGTACAGKSRTLCNPFLVKVSPL